MDLKGVSVGVTLTTSIVLVVVFVFASLLEKQSPIFQSETHPGIKSYNEFVLTHPITTPYSRAGGYRLGDIVKGNLQTDLGGHKKAYFRYSTLYPHSIATEYMKRTELFNNYDVLCGIASDRVNALSLLPSEHEVIVHIRLGDVASSRSTGNDLWIFGSDGPWYHVKNSSYYDKLIHRIPSDINKVVLVSSKVRLGVKATNERKAEYLINQNINDEYQALIVKFFKSHNFTVEQYCDRPPDVDFIYMTQSHYFIYGGGGFSRIIGECVRRNNGTILSEWEGKGNGEVL